MRAPHAWEDAGRKRKRKRKRKRRRERVPGMAGEIAELLIWSRDRQRFRARVQSRFFHWPWPPSDEDLRRLARSLGGVVFRPA